MFRPLAFVFSLLLRLRAALSILLLAALEAASFFFSSNRFASCSASEPGGPSTVFFPTFFTADMATNNKAATHKHQLRAKKRL